jgi:signal transduction histidine kinase
VYQNEQMGELVLAPRASGETFTPADRALLDDLARQTGVAAHAVRLTSALQRLAADVQRSREQLVTTREEERRRLRRDLHDGLGPTLATITVKAEAASDAIAAEPAQARQLLEELIGQAQTAIGDIRRLVYNLRPPALDDLGLVAALRAQALHYDHPGLHVSIEAPMQLPELSAAVEVAAYRIVQEALTNVVHHANARVCLIRLSCDGALHLEITDDGCGIAASRQAGVGLRSMQERAEEVGGTCVVEVLPDKGTRVRARLPVSVEGARRAQDPVSSSHEAPPAEE